ncbi:hypothetical protein ACU686_36975 [Yinghuangia aomiensis]
MDEENPHPFPGRRDDYDSRSYSKNVKVEAAYEGADFTPDFFRTWQNIVDFGGPPLRCSSTTAPKAAFASIAVRQGTSRSSNA